MAARFSPDGTITEERPGKALHGPGYQAAR